MKSGSRSFTNGCKLTPRKVMPSVWWDGKGIVYHELLEPNPGKMVPGKMVPREKWSLEKWSSRKMVPGKMVPGKLLSGKLGTEKSWGVECWNVINLWKPKIRQETQNSWCVCGIFRCDQSMKTQNSETNPKLGNKKNRGVSVEHRGVCVECANVINLWKPKSRQQIFLDSFSVLQFGTNVGSCRKRQTCFCVCSEIN